MKLSRAAGRGPLDEFHRRAGDAFEETVQRCESEVGAVFASVRITGDGIDYEGRGSERPSATWTYLVNDEAFQSTLFLNLANGPAIGAVGVAMLWPVLLVFFARG